MYIRYLENLSKILNETKNLISDNPEQIKNLKRIENLITSWQTEAAIPEIELRREVNELNSTMEDVMALIEKGKGKKIMDEIRHHLVHFKLVESSLMETRKLEVGSKIKFTNYMIIFGTLFIIMFSHIVSLFLADAVSEPIKLLKSTIKSMGQGIFPNKTEIESNNDLADLEESFEKIVGRIKSNE